MDSILDIVRSSLDGGTIAEMGDSLGEGLGKTQVAVGTALPVLITALSRRASEDNGEALASALDRDHDGEILRNIKSFVAEGDFSDGGNILGHVFGDKRPQTARALSNSTGLEMGKADTLMEMLAPVVLGAVGKIKRARHIDSQGVSKLLADEESVIDKQLPGVISVVGVFLDKDGDGETELTDLMAHGRNMLNRYF